MEEKNEINTEKKLEELKEEIKEEQKEGGHSKEVEAREKAIEAQEEKVEEIEKKHPELKENTENNSEEKPLGAEKILESNPITNPKKKEGSWAPILIALTIPLILTSLWDRVPEIKNSVHAVLDPSAGAALDWRLNIGMLIVVFIITLFTTIVQKYATDQETLKELKKEQKEIQKQMKEFKNHPEKLMELQKKHFKLMPKQFKLSMRGLVYTIIPFILFFKWFQDYFAAAGNPKLWLGMGWFLFYLLFAIIFGSILRKQMDVV